MNLGGPEVRVAVVSVAVKNSPPGPPAGGYGADRDGRDGHSGGGGRDVRDSRGDNHADSRGDTRGDTRGDNRDNRGDQDRAGGRYARCSSPGREYPPNNRGGGGSGGGGGGGGPAPDAHLAHLDRDPNDAVWIVDTSGNNALVVGYKVGVVTG
jgi:hypothetical protein